MIILCCQEDRHHPKGAGRMNKPFFARWVAHPTLSAILLAALLLLVGCGRAATGEEAEATVVPTATLIATMVVPPTPVPAEPVAVQEPTQEPTSVAATEVATSESITTPVTEPVTAPITEAVIATDEITDEITVTAETTAVVEITATQVTTPSAESTASITSTNEVSETAEMTSTLEITGTIEVTSTDGFTAATEEVAEITPEATNDDDPQVGATETAEVSATAAVTNAQVFFLQPTTNAIVPLTFTVVLSYTGFTISPARDGAADAGHMHILIDTDFIPAGEAIPEDEAHLHYGAGAILSKLSLSPGSHILRLQYSDNNDLALEGEQYRHEIVVNVIEGAPEEAVRIVTPTTNATVPTTFTVAMAATGISVEPAGMVNEGAEHFHLLIDKPYVAPGQVIPADESHLHFGKGQLTTTLTLTPGPHLIRLQVGDGTHHALEGAQYRAEVQVVVSESVHPDQVMFFKPLDGATVSSPFVVGWAASGLIIETAGQSIRSNAGHLHLLIDEQFIDAGQGIPMDDTHRHFGKGETGTQLTLPPGEYTLRLQMADGSHVAIAGPQYRDEITVMVK
jgi:hypothetical protein